MRAVPAAFAALLLAACTPAPPPAAADPDTAAFTELEMAQRPYFACVQGALAQRRDFDGRLPEMIVDAGQAGAMQQLRRKYLPEAAGAAGVDDAELPREARLAATRAALLALSAYGGGAADPGEPATGRVRRTMAMVETTAAIAAAAGVDCEPSDHLTRLMNKAEHDHL